ncbi:MAG TPA: two-component regulator propeller domain-containing protein [bacterium]|nr:two-component regulator propeller domain-containing protein [bacterium]HPN44695.1 two-component regulator propeller domain-containing protein [bacterium]
MIRFHFNALIILFVLITSHLYADAITVPMRHIGVEEGLSKSAVTALLQDKTGFMWIGTYDGLNRYDGYQFTIYRPVEGDTTSLNDNYIQCLLQDTNNKIWIGTKKGLNRFDPVTEKFQHISLATSGPVDVTCMCQDLAGKLWIGTTQGLCLLDSTLRPHWLSEFEGIEPPIAGGWVFSIIQDAGRNILIGIDNEFYCINRENLQITPVPFKGESADLRVRCFTETLDSLLLVGSEKGLWQFNSTTGMCGRPSAKGLQQPAISTCSIYSLCTDNSGKLWIGTWGDGLFIYDPATDILNSIQDPMHPKGMQFIYQIIQDYNRNIWVSSKTGIYLYDPFAKPFQAYSNQEGNNRRINWDVTKSIVQDPFNADIVWANTDRGLCRIQLPEGKATWLTNVPELKNHFIHSLFMEANGMLWIGTNGELISFDTRNNKWEKYPAIRHPVNNATLLSFFAIQRDHEGILWLGTFENGLVRFDPDNSGVRFFFHNPADSTSLPDNHIWTIYEDNQKRLWIGTDQGFALINKSAGTFKTWHSEPFQTSRLVSNRVRVIIQDHENHLWIGTDGGICRFAPETQTMKCYSERDGLPNHVIHGILQENHLGKEIPSLWISTNRGLLELNPESGEWTHYQMQDGIHNNEFSRQSFCKLYDGRLIFGGINGFTLFNPERFTSNPTPPRVAFSDFQLFYQSITPGESFLGKIVLQKSINHIPMVMLSRKHEIFSIEFTAFPFLHRDKVSYLYRLEGFNKDWLDARGQHTATFTNLAPGNYTLYVKALSADNIWSENDAVLHITMAPSFWQRRAVKFGMVLLLAAGVFALYKTRTHNIRKRNMMLEQFNTALKKQIDEKIQAEISLLQSQTRLTDSLKEKEILIRELYHRTKNNMQVISSMLRLHSKTIKNKQMKNLLQDIQNKIMSMALVHQKLYESNDLSHLNLTDYVKSLVSFIKSQPALDAGNVTFSVQGDDVQVLIDTAIPCGLVINELIVNSLKHAFTDREKGKITIRIDKNDKNELVIKVADNGAGLPEKFNFEKDSHLGLESVAELVKHQLQGTINFTNKNGLSCKIHLKEELYKPRI